MKSHTIYMAGPISGCSFGECTDWREHFKTLVPECVQCLSPMRGKDYLAGEKVIDGSYPAHVLSCSRGIMTRDFFDCTRADLIVVNLADAPRVSIGTVMEIAWGFQTRTPVIVVMEKEGNVHEHPMIAEAIGFRVESLEAAAHVAKVILFDPAELKEIDDLAFRVGDINIRGEGDPKATAREVINQIRREQRRGNAQA